MSNLKRKIVVCVLFVATSSSCARVRQSHASLEEQSHMGASVIEDGESKISAKGVLEANSCSYVTSKSGTVEVTFEDLSIDRSSKITLVTELIPTNSDEADSGSSDSQKQSIQMRQVASGKWTASRTATMTERGQSKTFNGVSFVIQVTSSAGSTKANHPANSASFYFVKFDLNRAECRPRDEDLRLRPMAVFVKN